MLRTTTTATTMAMTDRGALFVQVLAGGGHIAAVHPTGEAGKSPLWVPHWPVVEPALRKMPRDDMDGSLEAMTLSVRRRSRSRPHSSSPISHPRPRPSV
jgi:hypothetical protein